MYVLIQGSTTINLRFNWGHMENGAWTPDALPSFVFTFMDLDAGYTTSAAETVVDVRCRRVTPQTSERHCGRDEFQRLVLNVRGRRHTKSNESHLDWGSAKITSASIEFENKEHFTHHATRTSHNRSQGPLFHRDHEFELARTGAMSSNTSSYTSSHSRFTGIVLRRIWPELWRKRLLPWLRGHLRQKFPVSRR